MGLLDAGGRHKPYGILFLFPHRRNYGGNKNQRRGCFKVKIKTLAP